APGSPCGRCHACHLAGAGTHPDLHGPTEAGERYGIDELRAWLADLACRPVVSSRTVLWLPAPDRLGLAAASALLKTLEEPPEDAVVVLSARNARTLPPTIVSRAERHRLPYPERASALAWLERARPSGEAHEVWLDLADGAP
ncbi:MAG: DNA polymerase III subunit delta', partial [Gammaproteobacteria bacterium]|nr:DNA polymerase III subunit delta' [Gammaproteobacteria bacterium]